MVRLCGTTGFWGSVDLFVSTWVRMGDERMV